MTSVNNGAIIAKHKIFLEYTFYLWFNLWLIKLHHETITNRHLTENGQKDNTLEQIWPTDRIVFSSNNLNNESISFYRSYLTVRYSQVSATTLH